MDFIQTSPQLMPTYQNNHVEVKKAFHHAYQRNRIRHSQFIKQRIPSLRRIPGIHVEHQIRMNSSWDELQVAEI